MKKLLLTLMALVMTVTAANAFIDSYTIKKDALPEEAQKMLTDYFPKAKVSMIKVDRHLLKKTDYDVKLTNGVKVEFSNKGKWTSVDCGKKALPEDLLPNTIRRYLSKNFADLKAVSISKRNGGHDIGLSDGTLHRFDVLGSYKGVITPEEK
jgi:hypothetical protein